MATQTSGATTKAVAEIGDWELVCLACHWSYDVTVGLSRKWKDGLYRAVYARSDGYGEPGYVPAQGYDWSGVRDSTDEAKKLMAAAARTYLKNVGVTELTWRTESL